MRADPSTLSLPVRLSAGMPCTLSLGAVKLTSAVIARSSPGLTAGNFPVTPPDTSPVSFTGTFGNAAATAAASILSNFTATSPALSATSG